MKLLCKCIPSDISKDAKDAFLRSVTQVSITNALSRVTKYPRVVSSWSMVDSRLLIGTDDVPPLVVSPRARRQFPRIDISGSASSFERKVDVGGARCSRQEQQNAIFF